MVIGAGLPEGHPVRVAAITTHAQQAASTSPVRAARGQANLSKLNLSPTEKFHVQNMFPTAAPVAQPVSQVQAQVSSPAVGVDANTKAIDQAVNKFAQKALTQADKNIGGGFSGGGFAPVGKNGVAQKLVSEAHSFIGTPYLWGGESPKGFDCSGFAQYLYAKVGINIPRTTYTQWQTGNAVPKGNLQPGDLVFFRGSDSRGGLPGHVGVYIGDGMMIDAPHTGTSVRVESVHNFGGYMGARRYGK